MEEIRLPDWFKAAKGEPCPVGRGDERQGFLEKNLRNIASFMKEALGPERFAQMPGTLQSLEPRSRMLGVFALIAGCAVAQTFMMLLIIGGLSLALARISSVEVPALFKRVLPAFLFTLILAAPALFSFISPGPELFGFSVAGHRVAVTARGAHIAAFFITRVTVMVSLVAVLVLTTRQSDFFAGLRGLRIPSAFVTALFMTFRYVFILVKIAEDSTLARKSRTVAGARLGESQAWFASRAGLLLKKSLNMADEVNMAMASRGFDGKVKTFESPRFKGRDYLWTGFSFFVFFLSFGF